VSFHRCANEVEGAWDVMRETEFIDLNDVIRDKMPPTPTVFDDAVDPGSRLGYEILTLDADDVIADMITPDAVLGLTEAPTPEPVWDKFVLDVSLRPGRSQR
jgi:hypothetical protein